MELQATRDSRSPVVTNPAPWLTMAHKQLPWFKNFGASRTSIPFFLHQNNEEYVVLEGCELKYRPQKHQTKVTCFLYPAWPVFKPCFSKKCAIWLEMCSKSWDNLRQAAGKYTPVPLPFILDRKKSRNNEGTEKWFKFQLYDPLELGVDLVDKKKRQWSSGEMCAENTCRDKIHPKSH
jgi:hypothetical protein